VLWLHEWFKLTNVEMEMGYDLAGCSVGLIAQLNVNRSIEHYRPMELHSLSSCQVFIM
jgi:hypothetical protein